jgi:prophage regulatory protein
MRASTHRARVLLRRVEAESRFGVKRSKFYELINEGLIPPPVRVGARVTAWPSDEVETVQSAFVAGASEDYIRDLVSDLVRARGTDAVRQEPAA